MNTRENYKDEQGFLNCEMEFECPKNWFELELTAVPRVKHCNTCNKGVYLCITQEELDRSIEEKRCVAFFKVLKVDVRQIISMSAGIPSMPRNSKFKTSLEE